MTAAPQDIFVVLPNWIGDVVMATPMLRALRKQFPRPHRLVGIMRPYVAAVLEGTPWLDETIFFERNRKNRELGFLELIRILKQRRPETIVILSSSFGFGISAWLAGIKNRIGYSGNFRGWTLTKALKHRKYPENGTKKTVVDHYLELAYAVGCPPESRHPELATLPEYDAAATNVFANLGIGPSQSVMAINPGSLNGTSRNWPVERFVELATRFVQRSSNNAVMILCGPKERHLADSIAMLANHPRVQSMSQQDMRLGVTCACIRRCKVLITPDSGLRHIAAAHNIPVVCLAGPIDPELTFSFNPNEIQLRVELPCSPCGKHTCALGHGRCMTDLSIDNVEMATQERLVILERKSA